MSVRNKIVLALLCVAIPALVAVSGFAFWRASNAVLDALAPLGVRHIDMPATPERVWRAIQEAK